VLLLNKAQFVLPLEICMFLVLICLTVTLLCLNDRCMQHLSVATRAFVSTMQLRSTTYWKQRHTSKPWSTNRKSACFPMPHLPIHVSNWAFVFMYMWGAPSNPGICCIFAENENLIS